MAPDAVGSVGGQKRSPVLIAAIIAEGIVKNIRDCKTHYVNEKGAGRRKSGSPLYLWQLRFYLRGGSNGVALLDPSSGQIAVGPKLRGRIASENNVWKQGEITSLF